MVALASKCTCAWDARVDAAIMVLIVPTILILMALVLADLVPAVAHWWWYDTMLHLIAGAYVARGVAPLCQFAAVWRGGAHRRYWTTPLPPLGPTLILGVAWELFENLLLPLYMIHAGDTPLGVAKDLAVDLAGGALGYLWYFLSATRADHLACVVDCPVFAVRVDKQPARQFA